VTVDPPRCISGGRSESAISLERAEANEVSDARNRRCLERGSGDSCRGSVAGAHVALKKQKTRFDSEPRHKIAGVV
jgi:hypothetical protein